MNKPSFFARFSGENAAAIDEAPLAYVDAGEQERLAILQSFEELEMAWFWATDPTGKLCYMSPSALQAATLDPGEVLGKKLTELFHEDADRDDVARQRPLSFLLSSKSSFSALSVGVMGGARSKQAWWSITGKPLFDAEGAFLGYRGLASDVSSSRDNQLDASRLVKFDTLTGLANRHHMEKRLAALLTNYKASKRSCALIMLDLDRFKQVNDTLGHPAGDELLKQVAQRLKSIVGESGEIGRLGGDEFQIILPDVDDRGNLGDLANRVIQMVSQPYSIEGSRAIIGTSIGVAIAPYDGIESDELVSAADLALYAAKGGGRGQYRFYSSELKDGAKTRKQIEEDLRDALQTGGLELSYQPLVCSRTHNVKAFEALMRWNHPERGLISPALFIPVAEETSIIADLGEWALMRACRDAAAWPGNIRVAVNVSPMQFANDDFPDFVLCALKSSGLNPNRLELELTETVFLNDPDAANRMFKRLKKLGVRLALDDFGTGYSSLGYLRNAPFDKLKIDQSFVRGSTIEDNNNNAIVTAVVSLAKALKMETVAEGVEAMDELKLVTSRGADLIQGYIFSRPLDHANVLDRLEKGQLKFEAIGPEKYREGRLSVYRKIGVIHENHRYDAILRNLSRSGAMIEGILNVPKGTDLVLDLGEGQLAVGSVRRTDGPVQGVQFETPLIPDGADGLCTRHRVSPYALAAAGMPLTALPSGKYPLINNREQDGTPTRPAFMQIDLQQGRIRGG